jgi:exonuclease I
VLRADADFRARLIAAFEGTRASRKPSLHIEEQIYDGFFGDPDHMLMDVFHPPVFFRSAALGRRSEKDNRFND